ncbi:MAG TPA: UDP-forming cellulose synthase catalytic subunit, partial [Paraburkholderia sp.]|uniref:UDP-forming cellulose synthase catalytic subunit n=1 Tax=Paraburkholderia sp. TaxID=1926495 RepID=UPI002ED62E2E
AALDRQVAKLPWQRWGESLEAGAVRAGRIRWLTVTLVGVGAVLWALVGTSPLAGTNQYVFFGLTILLALAIRRLPGRLPVLLLASLSLLAMLRYVWWRTTQTLDFHGAGEAIVGYALFSAEAYTWIVLVLGFIQTAWPLERKVSALPADRTCWPSVDVYIPTYNEPLAVVKPTILAAQGIDWPGERLNIYLLDDGKRPEMEAFAREAGVRYLTRSDNQHAKAGNINRALAKTHGDYIAIFDCDHVPSRSFLQTTMGTFLRDPLCAMVQTPHHFFSPDPFERNLNTFRRVPNEGELFYGLVQSGNDLWNATFFCGSCAVIKRAPLEEVGGVAVETVTEDAHTALKLHRRGYTTAYLPYVQAAGLATESLAGHIKQRTRWARGMAQIFRVDNPFFGRGLNLFQRICYGNAMLHFFYGVPRLIFLTMPMAYLFFGMYVINASATTIAGFVLPYIMLSSIANSRLQGRYRRSFWAEVYESVLAWYIALPTTLAFFSPRHGKFNVTDKGGRMDEGYLDWSVSKPYIVLLTLNAIAMFAGVYRLVFGTGDELLTVLMNVFWTTYNLVMLGAAVSVAREAKQIRSTHRVPMSMPATLLLSDGTTVACRTSDYSTGGLGLDVTPGLPLAVGDWLQVCVSRGDRQFAFPVHVVRAAGRNLGVQFDDLTLEQERQLVQCTFGRADAWIAAADETPTEEDAPLRGLVEVVLMGIEGYSRLLQGLSRKLQALLALDESRY